MTSRRLRCLMLLSFDALPIGTVSEHVYAFKNFSQLDIVLAHVGMLNRASFRYGCILT